MKIKFLTTLLAALPLLSAGLYLLGLIYLEGYLEVYGVLTTLFPVAPDQALFHGFMQFTVLSLQSGYVIVIVGVMLFCMTLDFNNSVSMFDKIFLSKNNLSNAQFLILKSTLFFIGFLLFIYLIGHILISSYGKGKDFAKLEIAKFVKNDINVVNITYKHKSDEIEKIEKAMQIVCNSAYCAYWIGNETRIFQLDRIEKISIFPKKIGHKTVVKASDSK